ncbi:MAG: hypothetical protein ACI8W8_000350 [Rhodothermales bacterium]|jgi:hypothetical protein
MAVSEDGRYAFAAHSAEDRVGIWELRTSQLVAELDSPAPHFLLSCDAQLFVLGFRTASVQIYDIPDGKLSKAISVQAHAPTLLTAPRGPYFRGELLVSAGEYNSRRLMLLDSETGRVHRIANSGAAASVSYSGTNVLIQGEFGNSPRSASLYSYSDLRAPKLEASSRSASSRKRIWHPRPTPYWVDDRSIYNERVELLGEHCMLIADQTSDLIYALRDGKLHAHQLATGFAMLGSRELSQPPNPEPQGGGGRIAYQFRPSLAVSTAHGLHLFAYDRQHRTYVHAKTKVFIVPPAPRHTPILDAIGEGKKAHRIAEATARTELLAAFDTEFKRIAKTGDLDAIDSHQASQAAFETDGNLPMTAALYPASAAY